MASIDYLLSLQAVRERADQVFKVAERDELCHFTYHADRMPAVASYVSDIIERDFGPDRFNEIPPHGRWQHFNVGGNDRISSLLGGVTEGLAKTRLLIDLFWVSVLLDAGAGDTWSFTEPGSQQTYSRSEGLAVASLYMFKAGAFSSDTNAPLSVDGYALSNLTRDVLATGLQVSASNPLVGLDARLQLLQDVGASLLKTHGIRNGRPSDLIDILLEAAPSPAPLDYTVLWDILQKILIPAWPKTRTHIQGRPIGDAWPLAALGISADGTGNIQPFHKLTQWLGYSLTVPFFRILGREWSNLQLGTGLPEYRNGGLFVDMKVLTLKKPTLEAGQAASGQNLPLLNATGDAIIEWRAMTVALLDRLHVLISPRFAEKGVTITMAQMLEAGSWKAGRELAAQLRPSTKSSPILIEGDGTIF
ncbi:hypothetical protein B0I35DRAFT_382496 [Stachybotrys elegans]|uniref:Uracil catabolism protein 4 n=1 Tax=Stachybotrys elegans TaxID=80388 RepID=A0A8K0SDG6_9HYPO|nr:hypothetical protein B0I35DRAFT_382496 [Stachybotrys elegans]